MSKRLRLNGNLVLREISRMVDRDKDEMLVMLGIEPVFGVQYTEAVANTMTKQQLYVTYALNSALWDMCKDSSREGMLQNIFGFMDAYYEEACAYFKWLDNPEYETVDNPIPNGDPIKRLKEFSGDAAKIAELKAQKIMGDDFALFRALYSRGVTTFVLEDA